MSVQVFEGGRLVSDKIEMAGALDGDTISVFESMRVYDGVIFKLGEHLNRLEKSARDVGLALHTRREDWERALVQTVQETKTASAFLRITFTRARFWISVHPLRLSHPRAYQEGITVRTATVRREFPRSAPRQAKSSNYMTAVFATREMRTSRKTEGDAGECLLLDQNGYVEEGRTSNIFMAKNHEVFTPPAHGVLNGVTRSSVIELCAKNSIPVFERTITRHDVYTAAEVFLTYTSGEIVPVNSVDGRRIGPKCPGAITATLSMVYKNAVADYIRKVKGKKAKGKSREKGERQRNGSFCES